MTDIVNFNNASPQHIRHAYADPTVSTALPGDQNRIVTVYSGIILLPGFFNEDSFERDYQYPVLGSFPGNTPGIITINKAEFIGAIAMASFANIRALQRYAEWKLIEVRADLREVTLATSSGLVAETKIPAVVLTIRGDGIQCWIYALSYQVTVITKFPMSNINPLTLPAPTLVGSAAWNGLYDERAPMPIILPGVPTP